MEKSSAQRARQLWREEVQDPLALEQPPQYHTRRILLVLAGMLALAGLLVGLLFWLRPAPHPHFVPLWVTVAEAPQISPIPQAASDFRAMSRGGLLGTPSSGTAADQQGYQLTRRLKELADVRQPVVVYVAARAVSGERGEIFLLPADADPDRPATRLPLRDVLEAVKECRAPNKLLILDVAHGTADPRLGVLSNDVADALPGAVAALDDPNLLVLCSCSPGQVALTSEALGRSVFSYYLEQGLRGWADGALGAHKKDGRVSVKELAAFVQVRVDRWAMQNRNTRQTPILLGKGNDFPLHAFTEAEHQPAPDLPGLPKYPKWLDDGWKTLQADYASGNYRLAPYLFRHQAALLLRAEQLWRGGVPAATIQSKEMARFAQVQNLLAEVRTIPRPQPQSLALARSLGVRPDDKLRKDWGDLFSKLEEAGKTTKADEAEKARAKLVDDFLAKVKAKPYVELAQLVFSRAVELEQPGPQQLRLLAGILKDAAPQQTPRFVEGLVLEQLAAQIGQPQAGRWPPGLARLLLQVTDKGERAASSLRGFPWNKAVLEEAAQLRHEGEVRFWAGGYASPVEAQQLLQAAGQRYDTALAGATLVEDSQALLDEATYFLPAYLPYLEVHPQDEQTWLDAVQAAAALYDLLLAPTTVPTEVAGTFNEIRRHSGDLQQKLETLKQPLAAESLQHLIVLAQQVPPRSGVWHDVNAVLQTPFLPLDARKKLWQASLELERRLHTATAEVDEEDNEAQETVTELPEYEPADRIAQERELGQRRARWLLALFPLAGLDEKKVHTLQEQYRKATTDKAAEQDWYKLGNSLRRAWTDDFRNQYEADPSPGYRDRLLRQFPPLDGTPGLKTGTRADAAQALTLDATNLWSWLADRHRYQARDLLGSGLPGETVRSLGEFADQAAAAYRAAVQPAPEAQPAPGPYVQILPGEQIPLLTPAQPDAKSALHLQLTGAGHKDTASAVQLRMLLADPDWLRVQPARVLLDNLAADPVLRNLRTGDVPFRVELKAGADRSSSPTPRGFLAEARTSGRSYHRAIAVPLRSTADNLQVVFSTNPVLPDPPLDTIRLRPGKVPQVFYLYLFNPGKQAREVKVELLDKGALLKGGDATLTIPPGKSTRVPFPGDAPPPKGDLPLLEGPLAVRVLDVQNKSAALFTRPVAVALASPQEYVTVKSAIYDPVGPRANGKLSVVLQTTAPVSGPDIALELALPPERIPGLLAVKEGTLHASLKTKGDKGAPEQVLSAQDIQLAATSDREGFFHVHVDGYKRAFVFHTVFPRSGNPLTPRLDTEPAIRFHTPPFVQTDPKFAVAVEVDNGPEDGRLEVKLGRRQGDQVQADVLRTFIGPRAHKIGFRLDSASKGLLFEATATDWQVPLDTSGVLGQRQLQARLLSAEGELLAETLQVVTFDDTPPERVQIIQLPAKAKKGTKITVTAVGSDTESGIAEVAFFIGTLEDKKVPPKTQLIPATPVDARKTTWKAELTLPEDRKGLTPITVQMTNPVGLKSYDTARIELTDTDPATTGPATIKGTVVIGKYDQPQLEVFLIDAKGKLKDKTTTNKEGRFEFTAVEPGLYRVYSYKRGTKRKGFKDVTVKANETKEITVELSL